MHKKIVSSAFSAFKLVQQKSPEFYAQIAELSDENIVDILKTKDQRGGVLIFDLIYYAPHILEKTLAILPSKSKIEALSICDRNKQPAAHRLALFSHSLFFEIIKPLPPDVISDILVIPDRIGDTVAHILAEFNAGPFQDLLLALPPITASEILGFEDAAETTVANVLHEFNEHMLHCVIMEIIKTI